MSKISFERLGKYLRFNRTAEDGEWMQFLVAIEESEELQFPTLLDQAYFNKLPKNERDYIKEQVKKVQEYPLNS